MNVRLMRSPSRVGPVTCVALWLAFWGWAATQAGAQSTATAAVSVVTLCDKASRAASVDVNLAAGDAIVHGLCVSDRTGRSHKAERSYPLAFTAESDPLGSVFDSQFAAVFDLEVSRKARGQEVRLGRRGGKRFATITVSASRSRPVPERFISASGDWQSAVDYQVDKNCNVLAVRLGNRLAIIPAGRAAGFALYGVRYQVS